MRRLPLLALAPTSLLVLAPATLTKGAAAQAETVSVPVACQAATWRNTAARLGRRAEPLDPHQEAAVDLHGSIPSQRRLDRILFLDLIRHSAQQGW